MKCVLSALCLFVLGCGPSGTEDAGPVDAPGSDAPTVLDAPIDAPTADAGTDGFTFVSSEPATCPLPARTCASDWPTAGSTTLLHSEERFGGRTHQRTAYLHRPDGHDGEPLPLLVFLHGGNGSGARMFGRAFDELARGEDVSWSRNTATCHYTDPTGFADGAGTPCEGETVSYHSTEAFVLLLPEGIESTTTAIPGARHWEDGRVPSPGQGGDEEVRDDVGFIAHLLGVAAERTTVDGQRIYLAGMSNGGMMVERILCEMSLPGREPLRAIAAASVGVAAMPANLYDGDRRVACALTSEVLPPTSFVIGRGIPTPDCATYPCDAPTTDGDGTMPYGAPGERHRINSPDSGFVIAFEDTHASFLAALGPSDTLPDVTIGAFTVESIVRRTGSAIEVRLLLTDGGAHTEIGTRHDVAPEARQWAFLSSFLRRDDGVVEARPTAISGEH